jgi:hypothetical protein
MEIEAVKEFLIGISIFILCSIHIFFPYVEQALNKYKKIWVSVAGGIAVGYVFLAMLPKLSDYTVYITNLELELSEFLQYRVYLFALTGFMVYLAVDIWSGSENPRALHWKQVQGFFFCFYNFLVGYILRQFPRAGLLPLFLFIFALCVHFMGIDYFLYTWHSIYFKKVLRWLMASSLIIGWLIGMLAVLPKIFEISAIAFIYGAILVNVMTEELPNKGEKRYLEFLAGVVFSVIVTLIVRSFPKI